MVENLEELVMGMAYKPNFIVFLCGKRALKPSYCRKFGVHGVSLHHPPPVDWVVTSPTISVDWVVTSPTGASLHHPPD